LQELLQQSEFSVQVAPGCAWPAPCAQHTLFMTSQLFEQQLAFAMHCIESAAHIPPSGVASVAEPSVEASPPDEASVAESPVAGPSPSDASVAESSVAGPSVCIVGPSPGGDGESAADVSGMFDASLALWPSVLVVESWPVALSLSPPSPVGGVALEPLHAAAANARARARRSLTLRMPARTTRTPWDRLVTLLTRSRYPTRPLARHGP